MASEEHREKQERRCLAVDKKRDRPLAGLFGKPSWFARLPLPDLRALLDASCLTGEATQVVELGAADDAASNDFYTLYVG